MARSEGVLVHGSATSTKKVTTEKFALSVSSSATLDVITAAIIATCQASSRKRRRKRTTTNGDAASPIMTSESILTLTLSQGVNARLMLINFFTASRKKSTAAGTHAIATHQAARSVTKRETA